MARCFRSRLSNGDSSDTCWPATKSRPPTQSRGWVIGRKHFCEILTRQPKAINIISPASRISRPRLGGLLTPEPLEMFSEGLQRISWHFGEQHRVFLVSGTLAPLARMIARSLPWRHRSRCQRTGNLRLAFGRAGLRRAHERQSKSPRIRALGRARDYGSTSATHMATGSPISRCSNPSAIRPRLIPAKLRAHRATTGWPVRSWTTLHSAATPTPAQWLHAQGSAMKSPRRAAFTRKIEL